MTTDNNSELIAAVVPRAVDLRRAAALIRHTDPERFDVRGVGAIVAEIKGDLRYIQALTALAVVAREVNTRVCVPLDSPQGQAGLEALINRYAAMEHEGSTHNE